MSDSRRPGAAETWSLTSCSGSSGLPKSRDVRTVYDGPRSNVADISSFYLTRYGAPAKILDALGRTTTIERTNGKWPFLATAVVQPNLHRVEAQYHNGRGLLIKTIDKSRLGGLDSAVTQYAWNEASRFNLLEHVTAPSEITNIGYDATTGDRLSQEDGRGLISRTSFTYNTDRQIQTLQTPGYSTAQLYRLDYDPVFGNLQRETTPKGFITDHFRDALGRDTLVISFAPREDRSASSGDHSASSGDHSASSGDRFALAAARIADRVVDRNVATTGNNRRAGGRVARKDRSSRQTHPHSLQSGEQDPCRRHTSLSNVTCSTRCASWSSVE